MTVVYVAAGSAFGGVCRYLVSALLNSPAGFPWGTLGVNVLGSLVIGLLSGWLAHGTGNAAEIRAFAVVAALALGETMTPLTSLGAVLTLAGVIVSGR